MQIGRLVDLDCHNAYQSSGQTGTRIEGLSVASSLDEARAHAQQLLGLVGNVEPIVSDEEPTLTGFHRIESLDVTRAPGVWDQRFAFTWSATTSPVRHSQAPGFAMISTQPDRNGTPGGVTPTPWVAVPSTRLGWDLGDDGIVYSYTRTGPGGSVLYQYSTTYLADGRPRGQIDPANWYDMSPTLTVGGHVVTGYQIPSLGNLDDVTLDNGLIKIAASATASTLFDFYAPDVLGDGEWNDPQAIQIGYDDGSTWRPQKTIVGIQALRNDAEEVAARFRLRVKHPLNALYWENLVDVRLRRGGLYAEIHVVSGRAGKLGLYVPGIGGGAATAFGSNEGFYATSDDADGNRTVVASPDTLYTSDLTNGLARLNSTGRRAIFGLGTNLDGASAGLPNRATDLRDQFFASGAVALFVGA